MPIRVLIVDDSASRRKNVSRLLEQHATISVIGTARNEKEAGQKAKDMHPDLMTVDMRSSGALHIVKLVSSSTKLPILVLGSTSASQAANTIEALEAGATDFVIYSLNNEAKKAELQQLLIDRVIDLCEGKSRPSGTTKPLTLKKRPSSVKRTAPKKTPTTFTANPKPRPITKNTLCTTSGESKIKGDIYLPNMQVIVIGISTGGPFSLQRVIPKLPANLSVPVVIVQHMPPQFTASLAERLNALSPLNVQEVTKETALQKGFVYVAHGGSHLHFRKKGSTPYLYTSEEPAGELYRPSADVMFSSAQKVFGGNVLGVIMTGMGRDGTKGAAKIKSAGGKIIAQDENSCVVYGMPKTVFEAGLVDRVSPLGNIADSISEALTGSKRSAA